MSSKSVATEDQFMQTFVEQTAILLTRIYSAQRGASEGIERRKCVVCTSLKISDERVTCPSSLTDTVSPVVKCRGPLAQWACQHNTKHNKKAQ